MTITLGDTFAKYFSEETDRCLDCGSEDKSDRCILYTSDVGDPIWVCKECKAKRDEESQERTKQARESVRETAWRDAWEE